MKKKLWWIGWIIIFIGVCLFLFWYIKSHYQPILLPPFENIELQNWIVLNPNDLLDKEIELISSELWRLSIDGLEEPQLLLLPARGQSGYHRKNYGFVFYNNPEVRIYINTKSVKRWYYHNIRDIWCEVWPDCTPWYMDIEDIIVRYALSTEVTDIIIEQSGIVSVVQWTGWNWFENIKRNMDVNQDNL